MHVDNAMDVLEVDDDVFDIQMALYMLDNVLVNGDTAASAMDLTCRLITHPTDVRFTCKVLIRVKTQLKAGEHHRRFVKMPKTAGERHRLWGVTAAFVLQEPALRKACGLVETTLYPRKNADGVVETTETWVVDQSPDVADFDTDEHWQRLGGINDDDTYFPVQCECGAENAIHKFGESLDHFNVEINVCKEESSDVLKRTISCDSMTSGLDSSNDSESSAWIVSPAHNNYRPLCSLESCESETSEMSDEEVSDDEKEINDDENERYNSMINSGEYLYGIENHHKELLSVIRWTTFEDVCKVLQLFDKAEDCTSATSSDEFWIQETELGEYLQNESEPCILHDEIPKDYVYTQQYANRPQDINMLTQESVKGRPVWPGVATDELDQDPDKCPLPVPETTENIIKHAYLLAMMSPNNNQEVTDGDILAEISDRLICEKGSNVPYPTTTDAALKLDKTNRSFTTDTEMKDIEIKRVSVGGFSPGNCKHSDNEDDDNDNNNESNSSDDEDDFNVDHNDKHEELADAILVLNSFGQVWREGTSSSVCQSPVSLESPDKVNKDSLHTTVTTSFSPFSSHVQTGFASCTITAACRDNTIQPPEDPLFVKSNQESRYEHDDLSSSDVPSSTEMEDLVLVEGPSISYACQFRDSIESEETLLSDTCVQWPFSDTFMCSPEQQSVIDESSEAVEWLEEHSAHSSTHSAGKVYNSRATNAKTGNVFNSSQDGSKTMLQMLKCPGRLCRLTSTDVHIHEKSYCEDMDIQ